MDLATQTPVEIDTQIAALWGKRYAHQDKADQAWKYLANYVGIIRSVKFRDASKDEIREFLQEYEEISESVEQLAIVYPDPYTRGQAYRAWQQYLEYLTRSAAADEVFAEIEVLDAEWERRGRWSRAFLVTNGNGHVHSSMHCSTCRLTTRFHWVVDFSDHTEAEIVEAAGERACTTCYPSAPVGVKGTQMFTPDEVTKQQAREERERKAAEKKAAEIVIDEFYDWGSKPVRKVFKSPRAVTNALASNLTSLVSWGPDHPSAHQWTANVVALRAVIEAKGIDYDFDKALANARKRVVREGGTAKY